MATGVVNIETSPDGVTFHSAVTWGSPGTASIGATNAAGGALETVRFIGTRLGTRFVRFTSTAGAVEIDALTYCEPFLDISVLGSDDTDIPSGSTNVSVARGTDFGTVNVGANSSPNQFTVTNNGAVFTLDLTDNPAVAIGGPDAGEFSVTLQPLNTNIAPRSSTIFFIRFSPTTPGTKTAVVSIANNDADETPYTYTLVGIGIQPPDATLNTSSNITDGQVAGGSWTAGVHFMSAPGVPLDDDGFLPNFDLLNSNGFLIFIDSPFTNITYANGRVDQFATNSPVQAGNTNLITLGTNTMQLSALQSNGTTYLNYSNLILSVRDDDTNPPVWTPNFMVAPTGWSMSPAFTATWDAATDVDSGIRHYRLDSTTTLVSDVSAGASIGITTTYVELAAGIGITSNWLFAVDADDDRPDDRLRTPSYLFTFQYDPVDPPCILPVIGDLGADPNSEIDLGWAAAPDGGGFAGNPGTRAGARPSMGKPRRSFRR
ncbi:MAG: choice-of-anchor D domain-containing protein, partial [Verrucomicrobiota bacterium]